jgi:hypothetical protein
MGMSNIVATYNLRPSIKGDTWNGVTIQAKYRDLETDPWAVIDITGYAIVMIVEQPGNNTPSKTLTVANSKITILDAVNGIFKVLPFTQDLEAGDYDYRIILTDGDGNIHHRIVGVWPIIEL